MRKRFLGALILLQKALKGNWYDDKRLAEIKDDDWVALQRAAQERATQYYQRVTSHWWAALTGLTE